MAGVRPVERIPFRPSPPRSDPGLIPALGLCYLHFSLHSCLLRLRTVQMSFQLFWSADRHGAVATLHHTQLPHNVALQNPLTLWITTSLLFQSDSDTLVFCPMISVCIAPSTLHTQGLGLVPIVVLRVS